jgi:hypothetical protein
MEIVIHDTVHFFCDGREICESADVVSRIVRNRLAVTEVARCLDIGAAPLCVCVAAEATPVSSSATSSKRGFTCQCPPALPR